MNILITGINGALGATTALNAIKMGHNVKGFGHTSVVKKNDFENLEYMEGDLLEKDKLKKCLHNTDILMHFASLTGFHKGLSGYVKSNILGTATLLDVIDEENFPIKKIIFASSASIYGEGAYKCHVHGNIFPSIRSTEQLKNKHWDHMCPECEHVMEPVATREDKEKVNGHIYAFTKQVCEKLIHDFAVIKNIIAVSLRFPILFGPNQFKGIIPLFSSKITSSDFVTLSEDGNQIRDFIYLEDAATSAIFAMNFITESDCFNVGLGKPVSLIILQRLLEQHFGTAPRLKISNNYRKNDIRHIFLDCSKIMKLGFSPDTSLEDGIFNYAKWHKAHYK